MIIKVWIINILQDIINMIESEEDKTLPKDYLNSLHEVELKLVDNGINN